MGERFVRLIHAVKKMDYGFLPLGGILPLLDRKGLDHPAIPSGAPPGTLRSLCRLNTIPFRKTCGDLVAWPVRQGRHMKSPDKYPC